MFVVLVGMALLNRQAPEMAGPSPSPMPSPTSAASLATPIATAPPSTGADRAQPSVAPTSMTPAAAWEPVSIEGMTARDVAELNGLLVTVGHEEATQTGAIAVSETGTDWRRVDLDPALKLVAITEVVAGDGLVAFGFAHGETVEPASTLVPIVLFSADGVSWEDVMRPGLCGSGAVAGDFGYTYTASPCSSEPSPARAPITVFRSADGRTWTSTTDHPEFADPMVTPWGLATDGARIVGGQYGYGLSQDAYTIFISDTGGAEWIALQPFPQDVAPGAIAYGHGRFISSSSFLYREGSDRNAAVCLSVDAEHWECAETGLEYLPGIHATNTGYVGLLEQRPDEFTAGPNEVAVISSVDALEWDVEIAPELHDFLVHGVEATSHGIVAWGGTNPYLPDSVSEPLFFLHRSPLP